MEKGKQTISNKFKLFLSSYFVQTYRKKQDYNKLKNLLKSRRKTPKLDNASHI